MFSVAQQAVVHLTQMCSRLFPSGFLFQTFQCFNVRCHSNPFRFESIFGTRCNLRRGFPSQEPCRRRTRRLWISPPSSRGRPPGTGPTRINLALPSKEDRRNCARGSAGAACSGAGQQEPRMPSAVRQMRLCGRTGGWRKSRLYSALPSVTCWWSRELRTWHPQSLSQWMPSLACPHGLMLGEPCLVVKIRSHCLRSTRHKESRFVVVLRSADSNHLSSIAGHTSECTQLQMIRRVP